MKIGIPRALLHYYYSPFWVSFFEELGVEVVFSGSTDKKTVDLGVGISVPEICVPIKIFNGHVLKLLNTDVDYVFIPRMASIEKGKYFCPKFMGLPDMAKHSIPDIGGRLLTMDVQTRSENIATPEMYYSLADRLGVSEKQIRLACKAGARNFKRFLKLCIEGRTVSEAFEALKVPDGQAKPPVKIDGLKIGLLGYVYDVYDEFVSMDVTGRLRQLGVGVLTFEMLSRQELSRYVRKMKKSLFWTFSDKLLGAAYKMFRERTVDGVIHVTAFGCGPDSFLGKLLEIESEDSGIPFMTVRIDEHTGENHLQTRVEAFVDMLKRRNRTTGGESL
jgi:predicted nucleotide-binding protein (sugar kinase/HSP70/actin superfamily)